MARLTALGDMLSSLVEGGARLVDWSGAASDSDAGIVIRLADALLSNRGEASGVAIASEFLGRFAALDTEARLTVFRHLADAFDPDPGTVRAAAEAYAADADAQHLLALQRAAEPPRQELFRRLNLAPGGTAALVRLRASLLSAVGEMPELSRVDADLRHLLRSWFNRGFLLLRPIDWSTPAALLEKIIAYEAVHQIDSWDELRRRVQPPDRRCFAFFHPAMPDEPLIFVEVALTRETPGTILGVLDPERTPLDPGAARTAVFYSISNCQPGLAGISFGAFLIKQVVSDLSDALPGLDTFVTLSPVPGFLGWVRETAPDALAVLDAEDWTETARGPMLDLAARYLLDAKRTDGTPRDPVARFHLGNGAELAAIHWEGDLSDKGRAQSAGMMVNYLYRPERIEANHDAFAETGEIAASRAVRALRKL